MLSRELGLRKAIWAAALVAGLLPFLLAALPGMTYGYAEVRDASALAIAAGSGELLALVLGATVLGRELAERRLSFDLARPIGGLAIWAGRMGAVLILSLGSALVILLPATLAGGGLAALAARATVRSEVPWYLPAPNPLGLVLLYVVTVLFLAALAHVLGTLGRSRSPWLLLDAAIFVTLGVVVFLTGRALYRAEALFGLIDGSLFLVIVALAALLAAGAAQVTHGRTDARAGHRALSATLWSLCAVGALGFAGYARWFTNVSPSDLAGVYAGQASPDGRWVCMEGPARHRRDLPFRFLYNPTTGAFLRLRPRWWRANPAFSGNGSRCVWVEGRDRREIMTADLTAAHPVAERTGIEVAGVDSRLALSPSGRRLAVLSNGTLSVYEPDGGKQLASVHIYGTDTLHKLNFEKYLGSHILFPDEGSVAIVRVHPPESDQATGSVTIQRFDVASRKLAATGRIDGLSGQLLVQLNRTASRFILRERDGAAWTTSLRDGTTGALLTLLGPEGHAREASFLAEGGLVATSVAKTEPSMLWIYGEDGSLRQTVDLERAGVVLVGSEPRPGRLLVAVGPPGKGWFPACSLLEVDTASGSHRAVADGLTPFTWAWWYSDTCTLPTGPAALLALAPDGSLVRVDPATGQQTTLIRGTFKPK